MNRRELTLGAAVAALAAPAAAQTVTPYAPAQSSNSPYYAAFDAQISRLPAAEQPDVRAFYELNGWRPVWNADRLRRLNDVTARIERHGLSRGDFFDFVGLAADPDSADLRTTAAALKYARVLAEGMVRPETVEDLWEMQKNRVDLAGGLNDALAGNQLVEWYEGLAPSGSGYNNPSAG